MTESTRSPKVFISYAWEDDTKTWVRELATRLRSNGVHAILDQWDVAPGDLLPEFMEISVSASDFVLVVCTPAYKRKSDSSDPSGVGYEKGVITGELFVKRNQRKFIPILRKGKWLDAAPSWVLGKNYIDLRDNLLNEDNYKELLRTLYGKRETPPALGNPPDFYSENDDKNPKYVSVASSSEAQVHSIKPQIYYFDGLEFMRVPEGPFLMGSKKDEPVGDDEKIQHKVDIPYPYWIGRYPVTNEQYASFIDAVGGKHPVEKWQEKHLHPVVNVSWNDVQAYLKWLNASSDMSKILHIYRLPTEAEWEKAARGENGLEWPWGNQFDKSKCNSKEGGVGHITPVNAYSPQGDSPYGVADMAGNIIEWTQSLYRPYPYDSKDGREDLSVSGVRSMRGCSHAFNQWCVRVALRQKTIQHNKNPVTGFRVVAAPTFYN